MNNITEIFEEVYLPKKALIVFQSNSDSSQYVEAYDMDAKGRPINAHPLSVSEATELAKALDSTKELAKAFLKPKGLLPKNVLHLNPSETGSALWYTPPQERQMFFVKRLGISNGIAKLPALLWKAGKRDLRIFALKSKPEINTPLFHAPFFNLHDDGLVCMGTVSIEINNQTSLEDFIQSWEHYFFNSNFSHMISDHSPVKDNIVQLWQEQINTQREFPKETLIKSQITIKDLVS